MRMGQTVNKAAMLLVLVVGSAACTWRYILQGDAGQHLAFICIGALILGIVLAIATVFKPQYSAYTAPPYAVTQGIVIGCLSLLMENQFPGIVLQAVGMTFGVFACMYFAYKTGLIQPTPRFMRGVMIATGGLMLVYLFDFVMQLAGHPVGFIHQSGWLGIAFSVVAVSVAALNLILDFAVIEAGVDQGAPKYMEWYGAFALTVTLVWLYIELLNLMAKTRR